MSTIFAERPNFFEGQYLGADDLEAFLKYARESNARHLLGSHTWGIVAGIDLIEGSSPTGEVEYFLTPGVAVDGYGRLLVVTMPFKLTTDLFAQQSTGTVNIWIRYDEELFSGTRAGFQSCGCSDAYTRVAESVIVEVGSRPILAQRESGVLVGDETFVDARETLGDLLPDKPLACDGSVAAQTFPDAETRSLWLIPVGQVPWNKISNSLLASTEADKRASLIFRRVAGLVTGHIYPADGVIRLRPRWSKRQAGVSADEICALNAIKEIDLIICDDELSFREMIWLEGHTRFTGDARLYGSRLEFQEMQGTDYLNGGVPLALRRRPNRNEHNGFDLQVLLGQGKDGPTRLTIGETTVPPSGADPCAVDLQLDPAKPAIYIQQDAKLGIGTLNSFLKLPLTIRAIEDTGNLVGFEAADGSLAWQINFGANKNGLNFTEIDPKETRLFLHTDGNVGISTLTPEAKLDIRRVAGSLGLGAGKWFQVGDGGDSGRMWLQYGDQLAPLLVLSDFDDPPRIQFQQIGTGQETGPQFFSWIGHARNNTADLAVFNGRFGVGTVNPFVNLTVQGSLGFKAGGDPMIYVHETGTANAERMVLAHSPAHADWGLSYRDTEDKFLFLGAGVPAMTVELTPGRIGIGTTTPDQRLDVRGNIKLGDNGDFFGIGCLDNLRMIAGRVGANGNRISGSGFTCNRVGSDAGHYRVNFSPTAFNDIPIVLVTLVSANNQDNAVTTDAVLANGFEVYVKDVAGIGQNEAYLQDTAFNFIALGPRA
jgi:hypothetical protein